MNVFIIYDNNKGGYVNWSSEDIQELVIDYALHYYDTVYYPKKIKFINNLTDFLDKNKDTIHSKVLSDDYIESKIFEFALGELPLDWKISFDFLNNCGFSIKKIDDKLNKRIDDIFGVNNCDVVSLLDLEEWWVESKKNKRTKKIWSI